MSRGRLYYTERERRADANESSIVERENLQSEPVMFLFYPGRIYILIEESKDPRHSLSRERA